MRCLGKVELTLEAIVDILEVSERLSRFSRLDAQFAERKRKCESLPYGLRELALGYVGFRKRG
jgi:hypothetical protein